MKFRNHSPGAGLMGLLALAFVAAPDLTAQSRPDEPPAAGGLNFDGPANSALAAMKNKAEALHIVGAAVVAYAGGDSVNSWSSKMLVVGSMTKPPSQNDKGSNLLAIAYAKATEMAATLKNSGTGTRPLLTGELGWQGGVISRGKTGILIAAFSGGRSEDDVRVSQAGLEELAKSL